VRADFVNEVAKILDIKRKDMIEKDLILHQILFDLSDDRFFAANVLFKGGTCLIKSYFGYLRFSEDIDFTWKDQSVFNGMSQKAPEHSRGHKENTLRCCDPGCRTRRLYHGKAGRSLRCHGISPQQLTFGGLSS